MGKMKLTTIWVSDQGYESCWLKDAWDEYSIDENPDGFASKLADAKKTHKDVRVIEILVDEADISSCFRAPVVDGTVNTPPPNVELQGGSEQ